MMMKKNKHALAAFFFLLFSVSAAPAIAGAEDGSFAVSIFSPWNDYFATIYRGDKDGLKPGQSIDVWRDGEKIGVLQLQDVGESISRGKFVPSGSQFSLGEGMAMLPKTLEPSGETSEKAAAELNAEEPAVAEEQTSETPDSSEETAVFADQPSETPDSSEETAASDESFAVIDAIMEELEPSRYRGRIADMEDESGEDAIVESEALVDFTDDEWTFARWMDEGKKILEERKHDAALDNFLVAASLNPGNEKAEEKVLEAARRLGIIPMEELPAGAGGETSVAPLSDDMEEEAEPFDIAQILNNYGVFLMTQGRSGEACSRLDSAVKNDPSEPLYYRNRALAFFKLEKYQEAVDDAEKALAMGDSASEKILDVMRKKIPAPALKQ